MANDEDLNVRWVRANSDYLNILFALQTHWADSMKAAHACGHLKKTSIEICIDRLDDAWKEGIRLEELVDDYLKALAQLRGLADIMRTAAPEKSA